jgi:8-amino-7-oxononanoate synthase
MRDFTSSLYLGLRHASKDLRPWSQLTMGVPAALSVPPEARTIEWRIARLQGCEGATLAPSTLHIFWDLFGGRQARSWEVFVDSGAYPIARWGVERAAARDVPVRRFRHHDPDSLFREMSRASSRGRRPVVVADGVCPGCGDVAPTRSFLDAVEPHGGLVVLDDTQALGILGHSPGPTRPYGVGGGGSLRLHGVEGREVVSISSMAKGLGVPMAVLSGSRHVVRAFELASETRVNCSPVSLADLSAAGHALAINARFGDTLRRRLARLVRRLRGGVGKDRLQTPGIFPLQTLAPIPGLDPVELHRQLVDKGIRAVVHRPRCGDGARVSLLVTARHTPGHIDDAVDAIVTAAPRTRTEG